MQELDIDSIINNINEQGKQQAQKQAEKIQLEAQTQAKALLEKTQQQCQQLLSDCHTDIDKKNRIALDELKQAMRDLVIGLEQNLKQHFNALLSTEIQGKLDDPQLVEKIILKFVDPSNKDTVQVLVPQKALFDHLSEKLQKQIQEKSIHLAVHSGNSLEIGYQNQSYVYDISVDAIAQWLEPMVSEYTQKALRS